MSSDSALYIADTLRSVDRERYLTCLLAPAAVRHDLMLLYAVNAEWARIRGQVTEALIGRMKFQWWRDVIDGIYREGRAPLGNPLTEGLRALIPRHELTRSSLESIIDARDQELAPDDDHPAAPSLAQLEAYAENTSGNLTCLALEILGVRSELAMRIGRDVGAAYALIGVVRGIAFERGQGGWPLSTESPASSQDLVAMSRGLIERATLRLAGARKISAEIGRRAVPALLTAAFVDQYLLRLEACGGDPLHPKCSTTRISVAGLVWRWLRGRY